jgi:hypothetical protein
LIDALVVKVEITGTNHLKPIFRIPAPQENPGNKGSPLTRMRLSTNERFLDQVNQRLPLSKQKPTLVAFEQGERGCALHSVVVIQRRELLAKSARIANINQILRTTIPAVVNDQGLVRRGTTYEKAGTISHFQGDLFIHAAHL